jgi:hypothetical protein
VDIIILAAIVLAGILLESFISEGAGTPAGYEDAMTDPPVRVAGRDLD